MYRTVERVTICFFTPYGYAPYYPVSRPDPSRAPASPGKVRVHRFGVCLRECAIRFIVDICRTVVCPCAMADDRCAMRHGRPPAPARPQPPRAAAGHAHTDTCGARSILGRLEYSVDVLVDVVSTLCRVRDQSHRDKTKHSHNTHTRDSETRQSTVSKSNAQ